MEYSRSRQHSVRIADIGLGSNAGRITSIRSLPDAGSRDKSDSNDNKDELSRLGINADTVSPDDREALDGDHINLELSFAYQGLPSGRTAQSKAENIQYAPVQVVYSSRSAHNDFQFAGRVLLTNPLWTLAGPAQFLSPVFS